MNKKSTPKSKTIHRQASQLKPTAKRAMARLSADTKRPPDTSDIPQLTPTQMRRMARQRRQRLAAPTGVAKSRITIMLDDDLLRFFKAVGQGYQTRINDALRLYMLQTSHPTDAASVIDQVQAMLNALQQQLPRAASKSMRP